MMLASLDQIGVVVILINKVIQGLNWNYGAIPTNFLIFLLIRSFAGLPRRVQG